MHNIFFGTKPSWTFAFSSVVKILRFGGKIAPYNVNSLRTISDFEIPDWTPTLPKGISYHKINNKHLNGELIYPDKFINSEQFGINDLYKQTETNFILYIHGGAFCMCNSGTHRGLLYRLAKQTNSVILSVDYRRSPEYKYPIPLNDCMKAYLYLLDRTKNPEQIIIAGDSAGGNLVINLISHLIQNKLPKPSKCILISPWVDLTDFGKNPSWEKNKHFDFVRPELAKFFSLEYIDASTNTLTDVSPLYTHEHILKEFPPVLIEFGECEVLYDQINQFCKKLESIGINIVYNCRADMIHVFPLFHPTGITQSKDFFNSTKKFISSKKFLDTKK
jgi:acetyl esterase/lipase